MAHGSMFCKASTRERTRLGAAVWWPVMALAAGAPACKGDTPLVEIGGDSTPAGGDSAADLPWCGNDRQEAGEACDGTDLGPTSCLALGFSGGAVACNGCALDISGCWRCGNGVAEGDEACDGTDLAGHSCLDQGAYIGGDLTCQGCALVTSGCWVDGLSWGGAYALVSLYDLSGPLPPQLQQINAVLADPATWLIDELTARISGWVCGFIAGVVTCQELAGYGIDLESLVRQALEASIRGYIEAYSERYEQVAAAIDAATDLLRKVEVESDLRLDPAAPGAPPTALEANETWTALTLLWEYGCAPGDEACSRRRFDLAALDLGASLLSDRYPGSVALPASGPRRLLLGTASDPRVLTLEYGLLLEVFYEQYLIPLATGDPGTDSMSDLAHWLVDCTALARELSDGDGNTGDGGYTLVTLPTVGPVTLPEADLQAYCADALGRLGALLEAQLEGLVRVGASELRHSGVARLVDGNADELVDALTDGVWDGTYTRPDLVGLTEWPPLLPAPGSFHGPRR